MTEQFLLSDFSTFTSLKSIARNVRGSTLSKIETLPAGSFIVKKCEASYCLCFEDEQLEFSGACLKDFEIIPVENAGKNFVAAAITFFSDNESLRYRIVTSHESEVEWLRDTASRIGAVLGLPPKDYSESPR